MLKDYHFQDNMWGFKSRIPSMKIHTSDISHHLDRPFLKITGQAWQKHEENTRLSGNTLTKVLSLWVEARKFAHLQTEQTKLAFTAFLQTRCCVKTLSLHGSRIPFWKQKLNWPHSHEILQYRWTSLLCLDHLATWARDLSVQRNGLSAPNLPQSKTIWNTMWSRIRNLLDGHRFRLNNSKCANVEKKQIGQLSYRTPYALFAAGTSDKTTPMKNSQKLLRHFTSEENHTSSWWRRSLWSFWYSALEEGSSRHTDQPMTSEWWFP